MASQIVRLRAEAISPLLMHSPLGMRQTGGPPDRGGKKIPLPEDEARAALYRLPSGQLYAPADAFREAGLIAAKSIRDETRRGRAMMTQRFGMSVFLSTEHFPLFSKETGEPITDEDWEVHTKRVVVQGNGVLRSRALVRDWACDLEFEYDDETIDPIMVSVILKWAGKFPGVLDYRPGTKGPFGRFSVHLLGEEAAA